MGERLELELGLCKLYSEACEHTIHERVMATVQIRIHSSSLMPKRSAPFAFAGARAHLTRPRAKAILVGEPRETLGAVRAEMELRPVTN